MPSPRDVLFSLPAYSGSFYQLSQPWSEHTHGEILSTFSGCTKWKESIMWQSAAENTLMKTVKVKSKVIHVSNFVCTVSSKLPVYSPNLFESQEMIASRTTWKNIAVDANCGKEVCFLCCHYCHGLILGKTHCAFFSTIDQNICPLASLPAVLREPEEKIHKSDSTEGPVHFLISKAKTYAKSLVLMSGKFPRIHPAPYASEGAFWIVSPHLQGKEPH